VGECECKLGDLVGELDAAFLIDGRGEVLLFSLVSGSTFFFGEDEDEDLVKKPLMDDEGAAGVRTSGVLGTSPHGRFVFVVGDPCVKFLTLRPFAESVKKVEVSLELMISLTHALFSR